MSNNKKVATLTLGCKVNQYETDAMHELLIGAGYEIADFDQGADVYIVNTCSVTNMADRKSRQMLHRAKKKNPDAVIAAVGCYVQSAAEELLKDPYVDLVIGNNKKKDIVDILAGYFGHKEEMQPVIDISAAKEFEEMGIKNVKGHTRAYIKVQDGCNQFCSYCIIPYTRGRARSRKKADILTEVKNLSDSGYKEFVLTGIHLSSYGIDLEETSLLDLIVSISTISGVERIRLGSLEPRIITEEFAKTLTQIDKVCPHFHLSLQSGCDATLKRMNRHYTTKEYEEKCSLLRRHFDRPALTTDVIVGFPGETKEEFEVTYDYLNRIKLYEMHIFKYSRRKGTKADTMPDQIQDQVKSERSNRLLELSKINQREYEQSFYDEKTDILVEETYVENSQTYYVGHTKRYQKIVFKSDENLVNQVVCVTLKGRLDSGILFGEMS